MRQKRPCPLSVWFIRFTATFFAPAIAEKPIVYDVEVLRDGNSFSARRVAAIQNGKPIFYMTASFQAPENGYEHQKAMPAAPSLTACLRKPISLASWRISCRRR